jgi:hypothetical protein
LLLSSSSLRHGSCLATFDVLLSARSRLAPLRCSQQRVVVVVVVVAPWQPPHNSVSWSQWPARGPAALRCHEAFVFVSLECHGCCLVEWNGTLAVRCPLRCAEHCVMNLSVSSALGKMQRDKKNGVHPDPAI